MKSLYEAHLGRPLGAAESVRAASLELLHERRAKGRTAHPFYWGAFVAAGDWR
jgi:CHAT domain-containing protein